MLDLQLCDAWAYLINNVWHLGLRLILRQDAPVLQQAQLLFHHLVQVRGRIKGLGMFGNMHLIKFTIFGLVISLLQVIPLVSLT